MLPGRDVERCRELRGAGEVLTGVAVAGRNDRAEAVVQMLDERERLAVAVFQAVDRVVQLRSDIVAGLAVPGLEQEREVVETGGPGVDPAAEQTREAIVRDLHLVTQPDDRLVEVTPERGADPAFRVREVDEEGVGREPLDVAGDRRDERNRAQRVREAAWAPVLAVEVIDAVAARDLEVGEPAIEAVDLDGHNHRVGAGERVDTVGEAFDRDAACSGRLERAGQPGHAFQRGRFQVDEPNGRGREHRVGVEVVQHRQPERRAARADENDRGRLSHAADPSAARPADAVTSPADAVKHKLTP